MAKAFTSRYPAISRVLKNEVFVCPCTPGATSAVPINRKERLALWDTGASCTAIRREVAEEMGLKPVSMTTVRTPQGIFDTPCYYVDVYLPNFVVVEKLLVIEGVSNDWDVLIGMDIISQGDFTVSNHQGRTVFSFRVPSQSTFDLVNNSYLKPVKVEEKPGRNNPCSCGSGEKYKNCCGKNH